uniref:CAP-Gly domain-containing protein n=1 Tax=Astyanax mexicanus TaxID=7994 RepID=A0A8B9L5U4_ASTMX
MVGTLRFCGSTEFAGGLWAGVELQQPEGKNDGSVAGVQYFTCPVKHGTPADISLQRVTDRIPLIAVLSKLSARSALGFPIPSVSHSIKLLYSRSKQAALWLGLTASLMERQKTEDTCQSAR